MMSGELGLVTLELDELVTQYKLDHRDTSDRLSSASALRLVLADMPPSVIQEIATS